MPGIRIPIAKNAPSVAVIGGGPAGLMAAEVLIKGGVKVDLYDAMPSVGRKFLMAGKGGMNLTHSEPQEAFLSRFGAHRGKIAPLIEAFGPQALREWARGLGIETIVGSSGRVFPKDMKAAPLLRAWLQRLRAAGVRFHMRHAWCGWVDEGRLLFATPDGERRVHADAVVLALGGGSWGKLGSTGKWVPLLEDRGVPIAPLRPANCGFDSDWSPHFRTRFAGEPVKSVVASFTDGSGTLYRQQGEFVVTATGVEGSLIYALSSRLRDEIDLFKTATLHLDLAPDKARARLVSELSKPRGSKSLANHLRSRAGITGVKAGLLREALQAEELTDPALLATTIKDLPLRLIAARPIDEAISTAGGVTFTALNERSMILALPGVFCAGEMLDWEAPTGGYLLTTCFASGRHAGQGTLAWLAA